MKVTRLLFGLLVLILLASPIPGFAGFIPLNMSGWVQFNASVGPASNRIEFSPFAYVLGTASRGDATGFSLVIGDGSQSNTRVRVEIYDGALATLQSESIAVSGIETPFAFDFNAGVVALSEFEMAIYAEEEGGVSTLFTALSALLAGVVEVHDVGLTTRSVGVPVPPTLALLGLGLLALTVRRR